MTLRQMIEKRANVWSQMQEIRQHVESDGWTDELRQKWDRADAELVQLNSDIEREERSVAIDSSLSQIDDQTRAVDTRGVETRGAAEQYRDAFHTYLRFGAGEGSRLSAEQRQLLQANQRALQTDTGTAGGYTVPEGFWAKVTETMKYFGGVRQVAEIVPTTSGAPLPWPTNDDTSNTGEILEEGSAMSEGDVSFGQKTLGAYTASSKIIRVSDLLLQDTGVDLEGFLSRRAGERIGRIQNTRLTTGTGASQSQGMITGATTGKTTASGTAITYGELVDLEHSVDAAYRSSDRCKYMFHDLILAYLRKLLDADNRPLWQPSVQNGVPSTFNGYGYVINNDMASTVATTNKTVAFGDFNAGYAVRTVNGGTMRRLVERYAEYLQTGFFAYERFDGVVQDTSAYKLLVQA
jgi:HK97 family phage major capsid protein